jgi:hypothetical protein
MQSNGGWHSAERCGVVAKQAVWRDKQNRLVNRLLSVQDTQGTVTSDTASERPHFSQRAREMGHPARNSKDGGFPPCW